MSKFTGDPTIKTSRQFAIIPSLGMIIPIMGTKAAGIADALFSTVQQKVLGLLFAHPDRSFYINEMMRFIDGGNGAVQRELGKLAASGLVLTKKVGNQKHYQANRNAPIFEELRSIMIKTAGLADVLRTALLPLSDRIYTAFIYGSIAKGTDTAKSDIDVLIVGVNLNYADVYAVLSECESRLGRPINPSIYTKEALQQKLTTNNAFVTRILEQQKIFLVGNDIDLPQP